MEINSEEPQVELDFVNFSPELNCNGMCYYLLKLSVKEAYCTILLFTHHSWLEIVVVVSQCANG